MLAAERAPLASVTVLATDVDQAALDIARAGRYRAAQLEGLSMERRRRFLVQDGREWMFQPALGARITFRRQDLLAGTITHRAFDLVVCRNVVIYFNEPARASVHQRLADALRPGGLLFIGATESILQPSRLGLAADGPGFYRRSD